MTTPSSLTFEVQVDDRWIQFDWCTSIIDGVVQHCDDYEVITQGIQPIRLNGVVQDIKNWCDVPEKLAYLKRVN